MMRHPNPVSLGEENIGTIVMKIDAIMYMIGQMRWTLIGRGKSGCFQRKYGRHTTANPMANHVANPT